MVGFIVMLRLSRHPPRCGLGVVVRVAGRRGATGAASPASVLRPNTGPQDRVSRHL